MRLSGGHLPFFNYIQKAFGLSQEKYIYYLSQKMTIKLMMKIIFTIPSYKYQRLYVDL